MEKRTRAGGYFSRLVICSIIAALLAGCTTVKTQDSVKIKSETEIAVSELKLEWLTECEGLGGVAENEVGALLQDFVDLSALFAVCQARHKDLVQYLVPIVKKERGSK